MRACVGYEFDVLDEKVLHGCRHVWAMGWMFLMKKFYVSVGYELDVLERKVYVSDSMCWL